MIDTNHEKFFDFSHPSVGLAGPADSTHSPERQRPAEPAGPTNNALPISPRPFGVWYDTTHSGLRGRSPSKGAPSGGGRLGRR